MLGAAFGEDDGDTNREGEIGRVVLVFGVAAAWAGALKQARAVIPSRAGTPARA